MMPSVQSLFVIMIVSLVQSSIASSLNKDFNLPTNKEWMSLTKSVDFMPANTENSPFLRNAQKRLLNYYKDEFVDGLETQYDDYAQAWRYLGIFVDCSVYADNNRRKLDEAAAEGDDVADEADAAAAEVVDDGITCKRYLLWAAVSDSKSNKRHFSVLQLTVNHFPTF
jgi:hypothetical protein